LKTPVVTLTLNKYDGFSDKFWALKMMQLSHKYLKNSNGLSFYKMMGSGAGNGFNWKADFSTYALLCVWNDEVQANEFIENSTIIAQFKDRAKEQFTVFMLPLISHGKWSGQNPFEPSKEVEGSIIAAITRATISNKRLIQFWKDVPDTGESLKNYKEDILLAKGIGEWPIKHMATFSIWKNEKAMKDFAYSNHSHQKVIQKTRELKWYKEELFARFRPFKSLGTWDGKKILPF
tara:strand:+ start:89 stop:790 length:702 start_codon:yes stop_codon:yes gene_type:complete